MRRPTALLRLAALATSASLVVLSAAPGTAAQPLAEGTAVGLSLVVGGSANDSGAYKVSNDGSGETRSGARDPQIRVLGGQSLISAGTLAQNAATQVSGGNGSVVACAGLAGDGATVAEVGEGDCLSPGNQLQLNAANFDLSKITVVEGESLGPLSDPQEQILAPVRSEVLDAIDDGVREALAAVGDPGVFLDLGAIQSTCNANSRRAVGDATLADAGLYVQLPGQRIDLLSLPVNPPPNTKLVTDLDVVVETINAALQEQFATGLDGALAPLGAGADELLTAINDNVVSALAPQLAPLEENLLDVTLNKQVRRGNRSIAVTALDLQALPAARDAAGTDLLSAKIGAVTCATADAAAPPPAAPVAPPAAPDVPTSVPAGLADAPADDSGIPAEIALGGLALVAGAVGVASYRRRLAG